MCERYQLTDRAGAAIASSVLQDLGLDNEENRSMIIDYHKLRRERQKYREETRKQKEENFSLVDGLYLDGCKDATQVFLQGPNGKLYQSVQLEEHYTLVGEPGTYYLTHLSPENGTGRTIAEEVFISIKDTELGEKIKIIGTGGAASMTGKFNGFIQNLEELY